MMHIPWYSVDGITRLAYDTGVAKSTISRLLSGKTRPSLALVWKVKEALERRWGRALDFSELFCVSGSYRTASVCDLMQCRGCLPESFYESDGSLKPEFRHIRSGEWSLPPHTEKAKGERS